MLSRLSPLLRTVPSHSPLAADTMAAARALTQRAIIPSVANSLTPLSSSPRATSSSYPISLPLPPPLRSPTPSLHWQQSSIFGATPAVLSCRDDRRLFWSFARGFGKIFASWREYRKARRKPAPAPAKAKAKSKEKELELSVNICIEEQLPDDPEILDIAEMLRVNVPMAMKLGFERLKDSAYKARDTSITDVSGFEIVELSVLLCNDEFICKLNKEWRGEDHATDVLSMSQHMPELKLPILMLGDIVISVETAARQAEERGHTLLDEIRILLVHGLLHLLGFDHEISDEAEAEMEKEEEHLLKSLGWKGKGLIQSAYDAESNGNPYTNHPDDRKREGSLRFYRPKFSFIFCDMDGTLLNSKSQISISNAKALKEAISRGVKVVIATGKLELSVNICIEEQLPDDPEILDIAEMLRVNVPMAMKLGFERLKDSAYKARDTSITDVSGFEIVELSVLLCNDEFICKLNKEWRGEDHATDVLSMSQHMPELKLPILMLGDIVISVETAARQAEERGHTLLDEIRILLVHGLLHLLGFDHEISDEAEAEMEKEEEHLLKSLGWKGKGLIQSAYDAESNGNPYTNHPDDRKREGSLRFYRPKFSFIFCDMDGTLLNSKSQISISNAKALKEAISRGVKVVIATGKTRPAVISLLKKVDLAGKDGAISEFSPGVFLQGLLVYGRQGREIFRSNLDPNVCREAFMYSLKHQVPLIAFSEDRCLTLFEHPLVDSLHTTFSEPKAEIISTVEQLLAGVDIQKLIFLDTAEGVATTLRPYWAEATGDHASVVQAVPDMLEIVPSGTSKGRGVRLLLDHLGASPTEVMAIGDGENDVEMLELASLGVTLSNGSEKAKAVADVIGLSNDEDGAADAIYRYAF